MFKLAFACILHLSVLLTASILTCLVGVRIWPELREKSPVLLLGSGAVGGLLGMSLLHLFRRPAEKPKKTVPDVEFLPEQPVRTFEEWKRDLEAASGVQGLDDFVAKWSGVPRTKKPGKTEEVEKPKEEIVFAPYHPLELPIRTVVNHEKGPSGGAEIPNVPGVPPQIARHIEQEVRQMKAVDLWPNRRPSGDIRP